MTTEAALKGIGFIGLEGGYWKPDLSRFPRANHFRRGNDALIARRDEVVIQTSDQPILGNPGGISFRGQDPVMAHGRFRQTARVLERHGEVLTSLRYVNVIGDEVIRVVRRDRSRAGGGSGTLLSGLSMSRAQRQDTQSRTGERL